MKFLPVMFLILASSVLQANTSSRTFCVFDPLGANGTAFDLLKDYREFAAKQNVDIYLRPYTDEKLAAEDFKAKQCDLVLLTGTRVRPFNLFTGSIQAIGAVTSDNMMHSLVSLLARPQVADYMISDDQRYEIAGILPAGPVYLFVADRTVDTVEELSGKKIATFDYDSAAITMVKHVGGSIIPANSTNFAGKFNNGTAEIAYAPAIAYEPLEMEKGIEDEGGIIRFNLAYLDFQIVIHRDRFAKEYGQRSREYIASVFNNALMAVNQDTNKINNNYWIDLPEIDKNKYHKMFQSVRVNLRESGVYHAKMLSILRKLRCRSNPENSECVELIE